MSFSVPPAFAQAELDYRQQRIRADFAARPSAVAPRSGVRNARRIRLTALFLPRRRPNLAARPPLPAPHH
jgi:hypothetical protein